MKKDTNFGENISLPSSWHTPGSETELLELLRKYPGRRFRPLGSLHSWSQTVAVDDTVIDLSLFSEVRVEKIQGEYWATIGAGAQIEQILAELDRQAGVTLPAVGLITKQTIAGALSTGTHGSGKSSLSHYISEVRLACIDPESGQPIMRTISEGDELRAARCSLGSLGIIVSVRVQCIPEYFVEETIRRFPSLEAILKNEEDYPLQQFFLMPWSWDYYSQCRKVTTSQTNYLSLLYRWYWFLIIDLGLHMVVISLIRFLGINSLVRFFFRAILPWTVIQKVRFWDISHKRLTMEHELFRHLETEIIVPREVLPNALNFVAEILQLAGGTVAKIRESTVAELTKIGMASQLPEIVGSYHHHYPICIRKILPDDTLISMTAGANEPWYAISLITYEAPSRRAGFFRVMDLLVHAMVKLYKARPHWGKHHTLTSEEALSLYPRLEDFRRIAHQFDPKHQFRNQWTDKVVFGE